MKYKVLICLVLLFTVVSCAPVKEDNPENIYGFFGGLWHGFVIVWAAIGKTCSYIFDSSNDVIGLYASINTGWTYWLGYAIGIFLIFPFVMLLMLVFSEIMDSLEDKGKRSIIDSFFSSAADAYINKRR